MSHGSTQRHWLRPNADWTELSIPVSPDQSHKSAKYRLHTSETKISMSVIGEGVFVSTDPFERRLEVERANDLRKRAVCCGQQVAPEINCRRTARVLYSRKVRRRRSRAERSTCLPDGQGHPATATGIKLLVPKPQQYTTSAVASPQVTKMPPSIDLKVKPPATATGTGLFVVEPSPSWP